MPDQIRNLKLTEPPKPSYVEKGMKGASKPNLLLDNKGAVVSQLADEGWDNSSDHSPVPYELAAAEVKKGRKRITKEILANPRNKNEAAEHYGSPLPKLIAEIKESHPEEAQHMFEKVEESITQPWREMLKRSQLTRRPHWNIKLELMWQKMKKARRRAKRSQLTIDWELYRESRRTFAEENREIKRRFVNRKESMIGYCHNQELADAIKKDKKNTKELEEVNRNSGS